jgi:plastocyanin
MKSKTLTCVFGLFLASTVAMSSCREDPPPSPPAGTGGAGGGGGTGGAKTGGAGGAKTGGAGGAPATGGAGGAKADGAAGDSGGDAAGGTTDTGTADGAGGSTDTVADMVVTPDVAIDTVTPQPDVAAVVVNGCVNFENESGPGSNAYIEFKNPLNATEKCIQIRVGQVVKFGPSPDFQTHPLVPSGGDTPNPIPAHSTGDDDFSVTFPTVGTYGFKCSNHPTMTGAIKVVVVP